MSKDTEVTFTTDVEYNDERTRVTVEATFSPASSYQEYPGAYTWHTKASVEIDSVIIADGEKEIVDELPEEKLEWLRKGAADALAGKKVVTSEYSEEDRIESLDAARFEDMAYGPPDYD